MLERASARETAAQVALGAVASLDQAYGIGWCRTPWRSGRRAWPREQSCRSPRTWTGSTPTRCAFDASGSAAMVAEVDAAEGRRHLGGVVEVVAYGVPPGLGSHVHWDRRLDAQLAAAMMGIQAIKGGEVGDGFTTARREVRRPTTKWSVTRRGDPAEPALRRYRGEHVDR